MSLLPTQSNSTSLKSSRIRKIALGRKPKLLFLWRLEFYVRILFCVLVCLLSN